jgi:NADH:ubiquinone oxidoreductase subunit 3 (subunit A)
MITSSALIPFLIFLVIIIIVAAVVIGIIYLLNQRYYGKGSDSGEGKPAEKGDHDPGQGERSK